MLIRSDLCVFKLSSAIHGKYSYVTERTQVGIHTYFLAFNVTRLDEKKRDKRNIIYIQKQVKVFNSF